MVRGTVCRTKEARSLHRKCRVSRRLTCVARRDHYSPPCPLQPRCRRKSDRILPCHLYPVPLIRGITRGPRKSVPYAHLMAIRHRLENLRNRRQARRGSSPVAGAGETWSRGPACGHETVESANARQSPALARLRGHIPKAALLHPAPRTAPILVGFSATNQWNRTLSPQKK
jgi:hypothetical protein